MNLHDIEEVCAKDHQLDKYITAERQRELGKVLIRLSDDLQVLVTKELATPDYIAKLKEKYKCVDRDSAAAKRKMLAKWYDAQDCMQKKECDEIYMMLLNRISIAKIVIATGSTEARVREVREMMMSK